MFTDNGLIIDGVNSNNYEMIYYVTAIDYELDYEGVIYKFTMENIETIMYDEKKNESIGIIEDFDRTLDVSQQNEIIKFIKQQVLDVKLEGIKEKFTLIFKVEDGFDNDNNRKIIIL
jgi:hypothetical protein